MFPPSVATMSHQIKPVPSVASGTEFHTNGTEDPMLHTLPLRA